LSELRDTRLEKAKALRELGREPYALRFEPSHRTAQLQLTMPTLPRVRSASWRWRWPGG
jgi:Lysyl-tRNA synthetase (class II)